MVINSGFCFLVFVSIWTIRHAKKDLTPPQYLFQNIILIYNNRLDELQHKSFRADRDFEPLSVISLGDDAEVLQKQNSVFCARRNAGRPWALFGSRGMDLLRVNAQARIIRLLQRILLLLLLLLLLIRRGNSGSRAVGSRSGGRRGGRLLQALHVVQLLRSREPLEKQGRDLSQSGRRSVMDVDVLVSVQAKASPEDQRQLRLVEGVAGARHQRQEELQNLEQDGLVRLIRVANFNDVVDYHAEAGLRVRTEQNNSKKKKIVSSERFFF